MTTLAPTVDVKLSVPRRIKRQRTKGWRMPEGAVYVGRPSKWGNPYRVDGPPDALRRSSAEAAVSAFRDLYCGVLRPSKKWIADWLMPLRGHDLACWCPLDQPCHADVLLELANQ